MSIDAVGTAPAGGTAAGDLAPFRLDPGWTDAALRLSHEAGWNQTAADLQVFLRHGAVFGIAAPDGQLVGTAAALPYGPATGWVSMVLTAASWRGRGIATRLVRCCTALLQEAGRVPFLDATEAGEAVYARLGFRPLCRMQRLAGPEGRPGAGLGAWLGAWSGDSAAEDGEAGGAGARSAEGASAGGAGDGADSGVDGGADGDGAAGRGADGADALPTPALAVTLDRAAFGADRSFLLRDFLARPGTQAAVGPSGVALVREGARAWQVGPLIADLADAPGLVARAVAEAPGPVVLDLLQAGEGLLPGLLAQGFQVRRRFTRMALGADALPGMPARMLAAAGPEWG